MLIVLLPIVQPVTRGRCSSARIETPVTMRSGNEL